MGKLADARRAIIPPSVSSASLLLLIFSNLFLGACTWFRGKKTERFDRQASALRMQQAIERSATSGIWIKGGKQSPRRSAHSILSGAAIPGDMPAEVLAIPSKFDAVIGAIKVEAEAENLVEETQAGKTGQLWSSVNILLLTRQNQPAGLWRVREVPKLTRVAIVIDDLGQDLEAARKLLREPFPLTFSVLPALPHSTQTAREAHAAGREVMLHLPMEPAGGSGANAGPGKIAVGMRGDEVAQIIRFDLSSVPFAVGVNNHMGSRATADSALMDHVMRVLAQRSLYFVDSRTTAESAALNVARRMGLPAFYRSVFLDDTESVAYTLGQLRELRRVARAQGVALAIGHPHPTTIEALTEFLPALERDDIQLVPASQLVHLPEAARLDPPRRAPNVAPE